DGKGTPTAATCSLPASTPSPTISTAAVLPTSHRPSRR
ncbi:MAG: hypothetical protein AVDCRST_MAG26-3409, partial [uncultured Chloroflexia bacterium]